MISVKRPLTGLHYQTNRSVAAVIRRFWNWFAKGSAMLLTKIAFVLLASFAVANGVRILNFDTKATDSPSCQDRCYESYDSNNFCQCNAQCGIYENCCDDYIPLCASFDSCLNRCWAKRNESNPCHCDDTCRNNATCCTDHQQVCIDSQTCLNRCNETSLPPGASCYCGGTCSSSNNCCDDHTEQCGNETDPGTGLSCVGRCDASYNPNDDCQCNDQCRQYGNCCDDYNANCLTPDSCLARCNEQHDGFGNCYCDSQCSDFNNCCADFSQMCVVISTCENRCDETSKPEEASCYCDSGCTKFNNCCDDYADLCDLEEKYLCKGQCNVTRTRCDCTDACVQAGNCCSDYEETCLNMPPWLDLDCAQASEMKCPAGFDVPPVILFSIDGFKAEYLYREFTPNIHKLASCGVHAPYMRSVYPTKTFPNHYSIITGLYPESHGIIDNTMYDHELGAEFRLGSAESFNSAWWGGEPFWVTASNQGLKSATYFWPGSDVNITRYPDYWYKFDDTVDNEERMYQAFDWLDMPKEDRPSFITLYMDIVDHAGHDYGPDSPDTNQVLKQADDMIAILMNGLKFRGLDNCVNIIILADHGMAQLSCDRKSSIEDYGVNPDDVYVRGGAFGRVGKDKDPANWHLFDPEEVQNKLRCTYDQSHWLSALKYEYLPKRFHYAYNDRIEDVHLTMEDGWLVEGYKGSYTSCSGGTHGFDNEYKSMHALFLGHGPGFQRSYNTTEPFENIEVYNLMADLLNVSPAPNNGTAGRMNNVMQNPNDLVPAPAGKTPNTCSWSGPTGEFIGCTACEGVDEASANQRLNLNSDQVSAYQSEQLLYGQPEVFPAGKAELTDNVSFCMLTQQDYVTAFDKLKKMPFFVSYTLKKSDDPDMTSFVPCTRHDVRVDVADTTNCSEYINTPLRFKYLYPPGLSSGEAKNDAQISSNQVPMYKYVATMWDYMKDVQHNWTLNYNGINVVVGPAFDYDYDGLADTAAILKEKGDFLNLYTVSKSTPIPTHFFFVATRCKIVGESIETCTASPEDIEVLSFIIPNFAVDQCHKPDAELKDWVPGTLFEHVARIRDVELLTGLSFMPKFSSDSSTPQLRVEAVRTKTWLPSFSGQWLTAFLAGDGVNGGNMISMSRSLWLVVLVWFMNWQ